MNKRHDLLVTYGVVFLKLLFSFLILSFSQVVFYYHNSSQFSIESTSEAFGIILGNIRFISASVAVFLAPYCVLSLIPIKRFRKNIFYQCFCDIFYVVGNFFLVLLNHIDVFYYEFQKRRSSLSVFTMSKASSEGGDFIVSVLKDYCFPILIVLFITYLSYLLSKSCRKYLIDRSTDKKGYSFNLKSLRINKGQGFYLIKENVLYLCFLGLLFLDYRGLDSKPLNLVGAVEYTKSSNIDLVVNTPFVVFRTLGKKDISFKSFYSEEELSSIFTPELRTSNDFLAKKYDKNLTCLINNSSSVKNVVLFILESFSPEYIKERYNPGLEETNTPFLDTIIRSSVSFRAFANASNTVQAFSAMFMSLADLAQDPFIFSKYSSNNVVGLPELLYKHGFSTMFMNGNNKGSMYFDTFSLKVGFKQSLCRPDYDAAYPNNNDYNGVWAIYDEESLQFFEYNINKLKSPFFASVLTTAPHHPYIIPPKYRDKFVDKKGQHPINKMIRYTDYSIGKFFEKASKEPWFKDSLFVFIADHNTILSDKKKSNIISHKFEIPLFFYRPGWDCSGESSALLQTVDLLPVILNLLRIEEDVFSFGKDLNYLNRYGIVFSNGLYSITDSNYLVQMSEDGSRVLCFNNKKDPSNNINLCDGNVVLDDKEKKYIEDRLSYLKAIVQQYNSRMINNKLVNSKYISK